MKEPVGYMFPLPTVLHGIGYTVFMTSLAFTVEGLQSHSLFVWIGVMVPRRRDDKQEYSPSRLKPMNVP
jgi:hypothetical protein